MTSRPPSANHSMSPQLLLTFGQQEIRNLLCKELKHVIKAPQDQTIKELLLAY